jgi:uncharacterized protein (TIRG00374 family)
MQRNRILNGVQGVIGVAILLLLFTTIDYNLALSLLMQVDIRFLLLAGFCYFLNNLLMAYRLKKLLMTMGENIRLRLAFFSHMAGMLLSDFTPGRSGYLYVALSLNKRDVPLDKGFATITSTYLYDLMFKVIIAILGAYFIYSFVFADRVGFAIIIMLVLIFGVIAGYLIVMKPTDRVKVIFQKRKLLQKVLQFGEQSRSIQKYSLFILSISFAGWMLRGLQWYLIVLSMHQSFLTPLDALLLNPLLTLLSLIPLTPAGWGIQETGIVIVFAAMGISATIATSFALLTRLVEITVDLFFGTRDLFRNPIKNKNLFSFYNTIDGDIDEKAYNSDLLVQRYFQRRKTESVWNSLEVKAGDIIVDIGCGSGVQLQEIGRKEYALAVGIDVNLNAALHGRKKSIKNTDFIIADAQHLPVKASCVDKIVCAEIIEHVKVTDHLIKEISRVLKDGGEVVITTPNDRSVWGVYELFWDLFGRGRNYGETHLSFFSESGLRSFFPAYSECSTRTLFFISPLFALTNSRRLLAIGIRLDQKFEQWGLGVSILLHARK